MSQEYIDGSDQPNEFNQGRKKEYQPYKHEFSGSIYHVIPAQIFDDERLTHGEKLFYGLISGLTHRNGYSYCKDQYFADRMKSELRVIQDWLSNLERFGYIRRETKKVGMYWERKIYLTHSGLDSNNSYEQHKNAAPIRIAPRNSTNRTKVLLGVAQNCEHNIEINNIESPPPPSSKKDASIPEPPTKEEEEEISKRLKERKEKTFLAKVGHDSSWKKRALFELRQENAQRNALDAEKIQNIKNTSKDMLESKERRERHFKEARGWFGKTYKGWLVSDGGLCVWFSKEGKSGNVRYDITDEEWKRVLKWEIPDSPI